MNLRDAIYLLENAGLKVEIVGTGKVKEQSIPEGAIIKKGMVVRLVC
ncbi:MAG: PASTA domain-containing protein [Bacteroidetes bacterium]|nr:PASTA domain-containing protein [Bacteroidota bacterium]